MKKFELIRRIWGLCAPFRLYIAGILIFLLVQQILATIFPLLLGKMVNTTTEGNKNLFLTLLIVWGIISFTRIVLIHLRERMEVNHFDYGLSRHLSQISMRKYFSISMGEHHIGHSLIKRTVITKGESAISQVINNTIYEIVPIVLMTTLPIIFLFINVPLIAFVILVNIVVFVIYTLKYNSRFIDDIRDHDTESNQLHRKQGEMITNADIVYTYAQEPRVQKESDDATILFGNNGKNIWIPYIGLYHGGQAFLTISHVICLGITGYLSYSGKINPGMFLSVSMWIGASLGTLGSISNVQRNMTKNMAPIRKYLGFLDYKTNITVKDSPIELGRVKGKIEFRNVHFTYKPRTNEEGAFSDGGNDEPDTEVEKIATLQDVSFTLKPGKRYAFVGRSGAGKSTLVNLVLRAFDPQEGSVLVDDVDLRDLNFRKLREQIGLVPQDVALFDGPLKYNVTFGLNDSTRDVSQETLDRIAQLSRLSEFLPTLEKGWDTEIGERGIKLSGGQRQRVGIARALIKNPAILIFDEATSSLDTENEQGIRKSIEEVSVGRTTIIIAHRLATVMGADEILVFDQGKLAGQGTHAYLHESNPYYQNLVKHQVFAS